MPDSFIATTNTYPSRVVKLDPSNNFQVIPAVGNTTDSRIIGISQEGTQDPPGVTGSAAWAAYAGYPLCVYVMGDVCLGLLGANCNNGDYLKADANAALTPADLSANTEQDYIAKAEQTGITGDLIRVKVLSPVSAIAHV